MKLDGNVITGLVATAVVGTVVVANVSQKDLTTFDGCGPSGIANNQVEQEENPLKNRFVPPTVYDPAITFATLYNAKASDSLDQTKAAKIQGWVIETKPGGVESCNCGSKTDLDTHILVSPINLGDRHHVVICEVTPRTRAENPQWTQEWLKQNLTGHLVEFSGYLLLDVEHKNASFNDSPNNARDWRQSVAEIHPVTGIRIIR